MNVLGNINVPFGHPRTLQDSTECIVSVSVTMLLYHDIGLYKAALTVILITGGK